MRWENFGQTTTEEGHKVFVGGKEGKHEHGVGFLVHKDIVSTVMGRRPVSSRLINVRLRAVPFNITVVQASATTSDYDDNEVEEFYDKLQNVIDQTLKKDDLVVQEDWNSKVGKDACENWPGISGPFCNDDTNERGRPPHPSQRSGGCSTIIKERQVSRSRQHPSRNGPSKWRGCNHRCRDNLQQDLADWRMTSPMDPVLSHHTSQERQPAAVPELPNNGPHQSPKQSRAEDRTEQIEATSGEDHR